MTYGVVLWLLLGLWGVVEVFYRPRRRPAVRPEELIVVKTEWLHGVIFVATECAGEKYLWFGEDTERNRAAIVNVATRFAADSRLNFTPTAAAKVADAMRKREQVKGRARSDFERDMI